MRMNPYKQFNTSNLIPTESDTNPSHKTLAVTMQSRLVTILRELGLGFSLLPRFTCRDKHISYLCDRSLHCSRLQVPAGTDLYTFNNADKYPCMSPPSPPLTPSYYLIDGNVNMVSSSGLILRSFSAPADYNINHLLQPAGAFLGRRIRNAVQLKTITGCEVVQYLFKVAAPASRDA